MRKKKRQFHCAEHNEPVTIYRKGKAHRVMVCATGHILAFNPISPVGIALTADKLGLNPMEAINQTTDRLIFGSEKAAALRQTRAENRKRFYNLPKSLVERFRKKKEEPEAVAQIAEAVQEGVKSISIDNKDIPNSAYWIERAMRS